MILSNATYTDIPLDGSFTAQGDIALLYNGDAISNSLQAFLTGAYPDLFDLSKKGILRKFVNKPLNANTAQDIQVSVKSAIEGGFTPKLVVQTLIATPDYVENEWIISIIAYTTDTYTPVTLNQRIVAISKGAFNG